MGMCPSKSERCYVSEREYRRLAQKISLLQREMAEVMRQREEESEAYEREVVGFTLKEAEWGRQRKKLRAEVRRLRRELRETEAAEEKAGKDGSFESGGSVAAAEVVMEQMREERARRDEAVEKWKMLYLAIKAELDDLIQTTHQGGGALYWGGGEEDFMEEVQRELKAKDDIIEVLRAQLTSMEQEECKRRREVDILRQSLKIMSSKKKAPKHVC